MKTRSVATEVLCGITLLTIVSAGLWSWFSLGRAIAPPPSRISSLHEVEQIISFKMPTGTQLVEAVHRRGIRPYLFCKVNLTPEGHRELVARLKSHNGSEPRKGYFLSFAVHAPRSLRSDPDLRTGEGSIETCFDPRPYDSNAAPTSLVLLNALVVPDTPAGPVAFFHWDQD